MERTPELVPGGAAALRLAAELLSAPPGQVEQLGAGETFLCYGAGDMALLLPRFGRAAALEKLRLVQVCAGVGRDLRVRTPAVVEVGSSPVPHALCERVRAAPIEDTAPRRLELYEDLGRQLARLHQAAVVGAGPLVLAGNGAAGTATSWTDHCETFATRCLDPDPSDPRVATLRSMGDVDLSQWAALAGMVRDHGHAGPAVLCHYDNRLPNLPMDAHGVWLLDWDLARISPLAHELIKVFERPPAHATPDARAVLWGYGLPAEHHDDVIAEALVAVAMDGIEMSLRWIDQPQRHPAIRRWLTSIDHIIHQLA